MVLFVVAGCARDRPIYQVENHPIPPVASSLTLEQIAKKIITAGKAKRWRIRKQVPGNLLGLIGWSKHSAVVDISYDKRFFSIRYRSSVKLAALIATDDEPYTGQHIIHRKYNRFVRELETEIDFELSLPGS
jgi:hypothetical protein